MPHYIVVTWAKVVCLIYSPEARGLRVYISGKTMSAHVTTIMYHLVIGHKPVYVTNNSS